MDEYRIVRGSVSADGTIVGGSGFICSRTNNGIYIINFNERFNNFPTIVATQNYPNWEKFDYAGDPRDNAVIVGLNENQAMIKTGNNKGHAEDRNFCFIAIGG